MKLSLPAPSFQYDPGNEAAARAALEQADIQNVKRTDVLTHLQFRDAATGQIRTLKISSGAVVVT